jgi:outer membrane protein
MLSRTVLLLAIFFAPLGSYAQQATNGLPPAPPLLLAETQPLPSSGVRGNPQETDRVSAVSTLNRRQAEQLALKNNPTISVSALLALAQKQVVRETRADELPSVSGSLTGVGAEQGSRIGSGSLTASRLLNHAGAGVQLNQLLTDFGRTRNLIASSSLQAKASAANAQATREQILLATDLAFYGALEAQATAEVAESTEAARQAVSDQVNALTASKLKSMLDLSFAQVNLSQAKLLVLDTRNQQNAAMAALDAILGFDSSQSYRLIDDDPQTLAQVPPTPDSLIALALQQRPDLQALDLAHQADQRFSRAQHDQLLPTISALGIAGVTPVGSSEYFTENWYGAAGVNVSVPIFNGFRFSAEASEANLRAKASAERTRDLRDRIVRDVRTAWLAASTAEQRRKVTRELLQQAETALDLAKTRYQLGLSSIVELSQAQLQQTEAQIQNANARLEYESDLAAIRFQTAAQP